jgi:hypothetical protein
MERQLRFLEPDELPGCSEAEAAWRLDDETRRRGRDGVAAARRALAEARRRHAA